jgi:hypothetical protein
MISLSHGCHAKVERTKMVLSEMNPLLLMLWRERHPKAQEQQHLAPGAGYFEPTPMWDEKQSFDDYIQLKLCP